MKSITLERLLNSPRTLVYNLRGDIGDASTELFLGVLRQVVRKPSIRNVVIFINSNGGCGPAGQIAHNILRKASKKVRVITVNAGSADSAALTIFCAGDVRLALEHSSFVVHYSSLSASDFSVKNINRHKKYLTEDKKWDDELYKRIGVRFNKKEQTTLDEGGDVVWNVDTAEKRGLLNAKLK